MQKKIICICFLLALSTAQLTVNLARQTVQDANKKFTDILYTYQTDDKQQIVFDTRALKDYAVTPVATPAAGTDRILGGAWAAKTTEPLSESLKINGKKTSSLRLTQADIPATFQGLVTRVVGLQIPDNEQDQFFSQRLGDNIKTKSQSFSFFFSQSGNVNKIFFGEIQNYLTTTLITFPISYVKANNNWQLTVTQFKKSQETTNYFESTSSVAAKTAVFDSTTAKILIDQATLTKVLSGIPNLSATLEKDKCKNVRDQKNKLIFVFQLSQQDKDNKDKISANQFSVDLNDLLLDQTDGSCTLLLGNTAAAADPWVLGTTFLKNVYTYFNFDAHNIQLSNVRAVPIDAPSTDGTWGTVFIVLGILLALLSLAALLALIQPIKFVPQPQVQQKPVPQTVVQPQYIAQPQRVILVQQPVTYSINQSVVGQSPTRYVPQGFSTVVRQQ